jgi:beta-galactosidase GanA
MLISQATTFFLFLLYMLPATSFSRKYRISLTGADMLLCRSKADSVMRIQLFVILKHPARFAKHVVSITRNSQVFIFRFHLKIIRVSTEKNEANSWIEFIIPETAKSLASYDDPFFGKYPAVTENKFGKGSLIYEGCLVSDEIQSAIVLRKASEIKLIDPEKYYAYPLVIREGTNDQGKTIRYYLNYSGKDTIVEYKYQKGTNLFTNASLKRGDTINLKPWDVVITEE